MLHNKIIKSSYTPDEIEAARIKLEEVQYLSKPLIALNDANKLILLTLLIGENDKYGLYPIAEKIEELFIEYYNVPFLDGLDNPRPPTPEMKHKAAVTRKLTELNKELDKKLPMEEFAKHATKFNIATAFYPSPSFIEIQGKGEFPIISTGDDFKHSAVLSSDTNKGFSKIAVTPPANHMVYSYLSDKFGTMFLINCMKASSPGAWSKYTNGRSLPSSVNWGTMLLALGLHPVYKLEHRTDSVEFTDTNFFHDIIPLWQENFSQPKWDKIKKFDLKPFDLNLATLPVSQKIDPKAERTKFQEYVRGWYAEGNQYLSYKTPDALFEKMNHWFENLDINPSFSKQINKVILDLVSEQVYSQTNTRNFIIAFSINYVMPDNLEEMMYKHSINANFLHLESNPSPNIYIALRHLVSPSGDITALPRLTGISAETWVRYEQGTRIPHNSAWTSILMALDIHPIYRLVPRTDENELKELNEIYLHLHHSIDKPDTSEFYVSATPNPRGR